MTALPASQARPSDEALVCVIIARVARAHGVVLTPEDPLITSVYLNKALLDRYLRDALEPITKAIAGAVTRPNKRPQNS